MATATPLYGSENFTTTINVGGGIDNSQTTGIILQSVSGLDTKGGILGLDWASTLDTSTYEEIEYGSYTGNELTGVVRGVNGTSGKTHTNQAVVVAVVSQAHNNRLADKLTGRDNVAIQDANANEILKTSYVASAVNEITVTNAATGNAPEISATGDDTNIDLDLAPKGTGKVTTDATISAKTTNGDLTLAGNGTGKVREDARYGTITSDSDGATVTFNMATSNLHTVTLGGNRTLAVSNVAVGQCFVIRLVQDVTGSRTVTWFSTIKWAAGTTPTLTTTASKTDTFGFICTSADNYDGYIIGQNL